MNLTRDEAAQALNDIGKAASRVVELKGYHHGAPHFIVWGLVWLFANVATQFWPHYTGYFWPGAVLFGVIASVTTGFLQSRRVKPGAAGSIDFPINRKIGMTSGVVLACILCLMWIAQPDSSRQSNAMVSIIFPFIYMCAGLWIGWRLFAIGLFTAAMILGGYFYITEWFDLWMGVFAGGSLIAGGLWLRSA